MLLPTCPQQHEERHNEPQQGSQHYGCAIPGEPPPADQAAGPANQDGQPKQDCRKQSSAMRRAAVGVSVTKRLLQ